MEPQKQQSARSLLTLMLWPAVVITLYGMTTFALEWRSTRSERAWIRECMQDRPAAECETAHASRRIWGT
jgi:hypothetical protein